MLFFLRHHADKAGDSPWALRCFNAFLALTTLADAHSGALAECVDPTIYGQRECVPVMG
jgi:hypothetical protein